MALFLATQDIGDRGCVTPLRGILRGGRGLRRRETASSRRRWRKPLTRTVDDIAKLRANLEARPHDPRYIVTVYGCGYKLIV